MPGNRPAPTLKYESDGGPDSRDILRVLDSSSRAAADKRAFVKAQIVFWLLAATDGHAKNFSLFHERGGTYRLTPVYDVLSAWPIIGPGRNPLAWPKASLALAVRATNAPLETQRHPPAPLVRRRATSRPRRRRCPDPRNSHARALHPLHRRQSPAQNIPHSRQRKNFLRHRATSQSPRRRLSITSPPRSLRRRGAFPSVLPDLGPILRRLPCSVSSVPELRVL